MKCSLVLLLLLSRFICVRLSLGMLNFLEETSSLSHSIVFFISLHWSLRKAFLSLLAILWTLHSDAYIFLFLLWLSLPFFSRLCVRPSQTTILLFCICFSWRWSWSLPPVQCREPPSIILQVFCLSDLIPWIYFSFPLYNHKGFDVGHTWMI